MTLYREVSYEPFWCRFGWHRWRFVDATDLHDLQRGVVWALRYVCSRCKKVELR